MVTLTPGTDREFCPMLQIRPMGAHAGGEITGVDVKRLDGESFAPVYRAWLKYGVIVVRG